MIVVTTKQMKFLEAEADRNGNTYEMLMEKAGKKLAEKIIEQDERNVVFLCGSGNNAGDCFVAARYLECTDKKIIIAMLFGEPKTDISLYNYNRLNNIHITQNPDEIIGILQNMEDCLVVDGVFGTGFHGELSEEIKSVFNACNDKRILAVDVPSGGNCNKCKVAVGTLKADETITFGFEKFGMTQYPLKEYCGNVTVADIGIPESYCESFDYIIEKLDIDTVKSIIPQRNPNSHKGNYGRLLTICGSETMPGACIMAVEAALKSGVGIVQAAVPKALMPVMAMRNPEAMLYPLETDENGFITSENLSNLLKLAEKSTAVLIGCGLGVTDETKKLVKELICNLKTKIILDADGINCIADSIDIIKQSLSEIIVTPHPAEMGRLCSMTTGGVQFDRLDAVLKLLEGNDNLTVALKGAGTLVAKGKRIYVNTTGNAGMAKGGSGDVLAGITASLTAQGIDVLEATGTAVFVHGLAGDKAAEKLSMQSMTATDITENLSEVFREMEK